MRALRGGEMRASHFGFIGRSYGRSWAIPAEPWAWLSWSRWYSSVVSRSVDLDDFYFPEKTYEIFFIEVRAPSGL